MFVSYHVEGIKHLSLERVKFFENDFFNSDFSPYNDHQLETLTKAIMARTKERNELTGAGLKVVIINWKMV